jgi:hypothetical protein
VKEDGEIMTITFVSRAALMLGLAFSTTVMALAEEATLPARKAGIWEMKTSMDEGMGPREQSIKMCIDAGMEANTIQASLAEHKKNCEKYTIKNDGGKTVVDMTCSYNGRHVESLTEMEGDFSNVFKIKISSTTSDTRESTQQTITVKRTILQDGKYLGTDCGDLRPGEALAPDGAKILVQ